jgi:hypothetical protein
MSVITKQEAVGLAAHLFELELESISNDAKEHFILNDWLDKFGENSYLLADQLTADSNNEFNSQAIEAISEFLIEDFANGEWARDQGGLYNYMMPTIYGGDILYALEQQLSMISGVGIQLEIF